MKLDFDIVVSRSKDRYIAHCSSFPDCVGEGESESEAVEDLGNLITLHLSDTVRKSIDDVRSLGLLRRVSSTGSEALQNVSSAEDMKTKILEAFADEFKGQIGKVLFSGQLPINQEWMKKLEPRPGAQRIKKILSIGSVPGLLGLPPLLSDMQAPYQTELLDEGLIFGVPLSLN